MDSYLNSDLIGQLSQALASGRTPVQWGQGPAPIQRPISNQGNIQMGPPLQGPISDPGFQMPIGFGNDMVRPPTAAPGNLRPGIDAGVRPPQGMMIRPDLNGRQQTRVNFLANQGRDIGQKFLQPKGLQAPRAPMGRPDGNGGFLR